MTKPFLALALFLLAGACSAQSQVYRCGDSNVYTDKPCANAQPVDQRTNVIDAGPRGFPAAETPAAAKIIYGRREDQSVGSGGPSSVFGDSDTRSQSRGTTYTPNSGPR